MLLQQSLATKKSGRWMAAARMWCQLQTLLGTSHRVSPLLRRLWRGWPGPLQLLLVQPAVLQLQ